MYATDRKRRKKGRVVEVIRSVVFGMMCLLDCWLRRSGVSKTIDTSFVEGNNATDRGQNARKRRKTYCFSKSERMHDAATYFVSYSYNFYWEVRTRREEGGGRPPLRPERLQLLLGGADTEGEGRGGLASSGCRWD